MIKKGLSIIELIISISISMIIILVILRFNSYIKKENINQLSEVKVEQEAINLIQAISNDAKIAWPDISINTNSIKFVQSKYENVYYELDSLNHKVKRNNQPAANNIKSLSYSLINGLLYVSITSMDYKTNKEFNITTCIGSRLGNFY